MKTKAAILEELNEPLAVRELSVPYPDVGQVLVRVRCAGICGKQIGEISGWYGLDRFLPHLLGHEGGGVVEETGPGVFHVKKGDHVVMHWRRGTGIEATPPMYGLGTGDGITVRFVGAGPVATFTEYAVVSGNRLTPIPPEVPFEVAALMGCAVTTALGLINNEAELKIGQSIVIIGCGGVGLNVIRGASMVSACPIVAVDRLASKLRMAMVSGATHSVNSSVEDVRGEIEGVVGKRGADVVVECTGNPGNIVEAITATAPQGKTILVGQPRWDWDVSIPGVVSHYGGKRIFASQGGLTNPPVDIPRYVGLWLNGKLDLNGIVTDTFTLDKINDALDLMRTGECGRCVVEF